MTINRVPGGQKPQPILNADAGAPRAKDPLSAKNLVKLTRDLAVGFQDRIFGTEQGKKAAEWLASQMKQAGLQPAAGDSYFQTFTTKVGETELVGRNVCGLLRGTDPELSKEVIVVAGHFDSQQDTHVGANDNATGCAGVLAIAQALAKDPPKRSVLFVTFDGEEGLRTKEGYSPGRRGSRFYAANPLAPVENTALMVNMDELANVHLQSGRRDHVFQWASNDPFATRILEQAFAKSGGNHTAMDGYPEQPREAQFFTTDAEPLYRLGVPVINLLSGRYLENHGPEDDMRLVIPERMEVYGRLAHQCVLDAANHAESLKKMGITPGGLMPTYPLVNERRSAALAIPEEESFRLWGISARMPEIRGVCRSLLKELQSPETKAKLKDVAGFEPKTPFKSEKNLAAVRERQKVLLDEYHDIPKNDVATRREKVKALELLAGLEGVLSASLYVLKLEATGGYYMQRVPERLSELYRGAKRLGVSEKLAGIVESEDTKKFKAEVSADRAVEFARSALPGLQVALSRAVYALMNPYDAATNERMASERDLGEVEIALTQAAYQALGRPIDSTKDAERAALIGSFFEASLAGIKGNGDKWVERFAEKNGLLSFGLVVEEMKIPGARGKALVQKALELDEAIFPADPARVKALLPELYGALREVALGKGNGVASLDALIELSRSDLHAFTVEAIKSVKTKVDPEAIALAKDDPDVAHLHALHDLIARTVELQQLFALTADKKSTYLADDSSLAEVKVRLGRIHEALGRLESSKGVADEVSFWTNWLTPYLPLEGHARLQAKERKAAAAAGLGELQKVWPAIAEKVTAKVALDAGTAQNPIGTVRALEKIVKEAKHIEDEGEGFDANVVRKRVQAEAALKVAKPAAQLLDALSTMTWSASPGAVFQLAQAIEDIGHQLGEPAVKGLREISKRLDALRTQGDVEVGRKERSGPLGVLSIRAAQKRD